MNKVRITKIPPTKDKHTSHDLSSDYKRKVCGYARVSTDSDEQFTSYEAQIDYYTRYIMSHDNWVFVGVYTDEGISGTSTKHRDGFNEMIADALAGKIDLIVTKSVSRFARNTLDSIATIRKLKEHNVEVFFEKENIYTFDGKGELLLTIMSSLAQEESRSISENVTWGHRKRMADGKFSLGYSRFLGYDKGADGSLVINEREAEVVRYIYHEFIAGRSMSCIAKRLTERGIPTPGGCSVWQSTTIRSIILNEKYKGDALLQKSYTVDFLTKKVKVNEGEVAQYYIENSHPAIIPPDEWEQAQAELQRRSKAKHSYSCADSLFSSRIICDDCGSFYGRKVWHSNDKYRRTIWRCNGKFEGDRICRTPVIDDIVIKYSFAKALHILLSDKKQLISDCNEIIRELTDNTGIDAEITTAESERDNICILLEAAKKDAASGKPITDTFSELEQRYDEVSATIASLERRRRDRTVRAAEIIKFIGAISTKEAEPDDFSEELWIAAIDHLTAYTDSTLGFTFRNGEEVRVGV